MINIRNEGGNYLYISYKYQKDNEEILAKTYAKKFNNLMEIDKFLEKFNLPKLNKKKKENLNSLICVKSIEHKILKSSHKESPRPNDSMGEFYQTLKEEIIPTYTNSFRRWKRSERIHLIFRPI